MYSNDAVSILCLLHIAQENRSKCHDGIYWCIEYSEDLLLAVNGNSQKIDHQLIHSAGGLFFGICSSSIMGLSVKEHPA